MLLWEILNALGLQEHDFAWSRSALAPRLPQKHPPSRISNSGWKWAFTCKHWESSAIYLFSFHLTAKLLD